MFLLILGYGFFMGIKHKDILLTSFLIIITITAISEDILNYSRGIFFYGFFIALFLNIYKKPQDSTASSIEATSSVAIAF
jgi:hypothetical protein